MLLNENLQEDNEPDGFDKMRSKMLVRQSIDAALNLGKEEPEEVIDIDAIRRRLNSNS